MRVDPSTSKMHTIHSNMAHARAADAPFTVPLLRPDYLAENDGQDTFMAHAESSSPVEAIAKARAEAAKADKLDCYGPSVSGDDYFVSWCCPATSRT